MTKANTLTIAEGKKVYFASDAHFGLELFNSPIESQKHFCKWLDSIRPDCGALFLLGDMFDYWFEYRSVVPKGFVRFMAKLTEFTDNGIPVYIFYGNHDMWMTDYLEKECGCTIVPDYWEGDLLGKRFHMEHGDANGDPSISFKLMRKFFRNKFAQWCFRWIHPDLTMWFGYLWSNRNRKRKKDSKEKNFLGEDKEFQIQWAKKDFAKHQEIDYYVFGHRHIELMFPLQNGEKKATLAIIGEWINRCTYGVFDGKEFKLMNWRAD